MRVRRVSSPSGHARWSDFRSDVSHRDLPLAERLTASMSNARVSFRRTRMGPRSNPMSPKDGVHETRL